MYYAFSLHRRRTTAFQPDGEPPYAWQVAFSGYENPTSRAFATVGISAPEFEGDSLAHSTSGKPSLQPHKRQQCEDDWPVSYSTGLLPFLCPRQRIRPEARLSRPFCL